MAFDEAVARRVRRALAGYTGVTEKKMFGGLAFMLNGNMCCGILKSDLVLRLGADAADAALRERHTRTMDFTGRPMKGMVYVEPKGFATDQALGRWIDRAVAFATSLPRKKAARKKTEK